MQLEYSTHSQEPRHRFDYWHEVVCRHCIPADSHRAQGDGAGPGGFGATLSVRSLGLLEISAMSAPSHRWVRNAAHLRLHARDELWLGYLLQGQAEVRRLAAQIEGILDNFSRPLVRLENEVVGALGELAVRIAGALVGRAYEAEPALLAQLVGEAIDAVGGSTREVEVRLHPDDIAALAPLLNLSPQQRLVPDTSLSRGDLRVHAEAVRIDGTLEARLRGALDAVIRQTGAIA